MNLAKMSTERIVKLAQAAIEAKAKLDASRPGGFKHIFLYEEHRETMRLFQAQVTPEVFLKMAIPTPSINPPERK